MKEHSALRTGVYLNQIASTLCATMPRTGSPCVAKQLKLSDSRDAVFRLLIRHNDIANILTGVPNLIVSGQLLIKGAAVADIGGAGDGVGGLVEDGSTADIALANGRVVA